MGVGNMTLGEALPLLGTRLACQEAGTVSLPHGAAVGMQACDACCMVGPRLL